LAEGVFRHNTVLTAAFSSSVTSQAKNQLWEEIRRQVNLVGGHNRTLIDIKLKHKNLKNSAKTKTMKNKKSAAKTGGGNNEEKSISSAESVLASTLKPVDLNGVEGGIDLFTDQGL
jgi:hypothetical protein